MTWSFTKENLYREAPLSRGVYLLFDGNNLIYIGRAAGNGAFRI